MGFPMCVATRARATRSGVCATPSPGRLFLMTKQELSPYAQVREHITTITSTTPCEALMAGR